MKNRQISSSFPISVVFFSRENLSLGRPWSHGWTMSKCDKKSEWMVKTRDGAQTCPRQPAALAVSTKNEGPICGENWKVHGEAYSRKMAESGHVFCAV
jgi:hypothetical protein